MNRRFYRKRTEKSVLKAHSLSPPICNEHSNQNIVNGWLHGGNVGHFDKDGYLYIKDRIKDMINRGGEKIFSLPVEDTIMRFGGIKQVAVFAVKDDLYSEVPGAVIIPEHGVSINLDELTPFLRAHLSHYKVPKYMEIRKTMPSTANGKVQKFVLKKEFEEKYGAALNSV